MTNYNEAGSNFFLSKEDDVKVHKKLPAGTYLINFDPMRGQFYLSKHASFEMPAKFYGKFEDKAARIINTFKNRSKSTGVILAGEKGSGKTLLTKYISIELCKEDYATIIVNQPYKGDGFNSFLEMITDPAVIIFDEFEKHYDKDSQNELLTLFDGMSSSKKLYLLTCNEEHLLVPYFKNRPGRFYYRFEYKGLDEDTIIQYVEENLKNKANQASILTYYDLLQPINFDMLSAIVEEMNRYDEPFSEVLKYLNISPSGDPRKYWDLQYVEALDPDFKIFEEDLKKYNWYFAPQNPHDCYIEIKEEKAKSAPDSLYEKLHYIPREDYTLDLEEYFSAEKITFLNKTRVSYNTKRFKYTFVEKKVKVFNYMDFIL